MNSTTEHIFVEKLEEYFFDTPSYLELLKINSNTYLVYF